MYRKKGCRVVVEKLFEVGKRLRNKGMTEILRENLSML
jgi:hypothetical protein